MLNELDKELERRGHRYVRYADDCIIFCKSRKSAERTLEHIIPYITGKLFLKVNLQKTTVSHVSKVKYLGYGFYRYRGKCRLRVHPKSVEKMKKPLEGADNQREQVEQPGKRKEAQGIYDRVDKLFQVCRHEETDGNNG